MWTEVWVRMQLLQISENIIAQWRAGEKSEVLEKNNPKGIILLRTEDDSFSLFAIKV